MKKFAIILTVAATLASRGAFAQDNMSTGTGATAGKCYSSNTMAWGIGIGMLVAVGLVVGFTVGGASGSESSFSH